MSLSGYSWGNDKMLWSSLWSYGTLDVQETAEKSYMNSVHLHQPYPLWYHLKQVASKNGPSFNTVQTEKEMTIKIAFLHHQASTLLSDVSEAGSFRPSSSS